VRRVYLITHPDVIINPAVPVPLWPLSPQGRERMQKMLLQPWVCNIGSIYCSAEQKAVDGAEILARFLSIPFTQIGGLGEIDRTATGYLPYTEHEQVVDMFFAHPDRSASGWETASHAQQRIAFALETIIEDDTAQGDIAVISHGGVATLYLCRIKGASIVRREAPPNKNGGSYYCFDAQSKSLIHDWKLIDST